MKQLAIGFVLVLGVGCVSSSETDSSLSGGVLGPASCHSEDRDDCKIEGADIGREGAMVVLDRGTATFVDWIPKAGSPGEYIGFSLVLDGTTGDVPFAIKAGGEVHQATGTFWKHVGAECSGISNVDFGNEVDGGIGDGGDGGGTGCDNADGCEDGGGTNPL